MTKKAKQYSAEEKVKVAIEALKGEMTLSQISSKFGVHFTQIQKWKKEAVESMVLGFKNKAKPKDASGEELIKQLYEQIGQVTVDGIGLKKNLPCLEVEAKKALIEEDFKGLSIVKQCALIGLNRSSYYKKPSGLTEEDLNIMKRIDEIFTEYPFYGTRRMKHALREEGRFIGRKKLKTYYYLLGITAIYPKINISKRNQAHKLYPYLIYRVGDYGT